MTIMIFFYSTLCICIFAVYYLVTTISYDVNGVLFGLSSNLAIYVTMLGGIYLFFLMLIIFHRKNNGSSLPPKHDESSNAGNQLLKNLPAILALGLGILFLYKIYVNEDYIYPFWSSKCYIRGNVSKPIYSVILCSSYLIFILFSRNSSCSKSSTRVAFGVMAGVLCAVLVYAPNPFTDRGGGLYHAHAYTNSIINVARLKPFDQYNLSIYGHYALIYLPLVKLLGNDYTAVALSISIAAFITYCSAFIVCEKTIKNDGCFVLTVVAICAVTVMFYTGGQYYQVNPHRILFPVVTLLAILMCQEKNLHLKTRWIIELFIGSLALIWNTETGLFSVVTFCFFNILSDDRKRIQSGLKSVALLISCFALSYATVNLYSFLTGAERWMTLKRFIYPIGSDTYSISALGIKYPTPYSLFVLQMMIFSVVLMNVAIHLKEKKTEKYTNSRIVLACTALSGLGSLSYFANRPAYSNISISCIQMLIIAGIYGSEGIGELNDRYTRRAAFQSYSFKTSGKLLLLLCVFIFGAETTLSLGNTISNRISTTWKTDELHLFLQELNESVPDDTIGMGKGVPELFFQLGRDTKCVLTDWADMNDDNLQEAHKLLKDHNGYLLVNTDIVIEMDDYITVDEKPFGDDTYALCKKTNPTA